ncbi:MAG TPA: prepilin peptidase [Pirellulales bacterium]
MPPELWFLLLSLFVLGTIIGSFLNVVIYRLPAGLSLVRPGSQCPKCRRPIRWYDNVPIFGWLWLRGRCRDCGAAISIRYPLVELFIGLVFLALGWNDWVRPQQLAIRASVEQAAARDFAPNAAATAADPAQVVETAAPTTEQFIWRLVYHLLLVCLLFTATLIDDDGNRLPRRLITGPAGLGILIAVFWPSVQAFPLFRAQAAAAEGISLLALATSFVGMLTAVVLRVATQRFLGVARAQEMGLWNCTLALYAVGAFLGWQAVLIVGVFAIVWAFIVKLPALKVVSVHVRPTAVAFLATLVWSLTERNLISSI